MTGPGDVLLLDHPSYPQPVFPVGYPTPPVVSLPYATSPRPLSQGSFHCDQVPRPSTPVIGRAGGSLARPTSGYFVADPNLHKQLPRPPLETYVGPSINQVVPASRPFTGTRRRNHSISGTRRPISVVSDLDDLDRARRARREYRRRLAELGVVESSSVGSGYSGYRTYH